MAYGKFTERVVNDALDRDLSAKAGAEHLAKCLRAYWAAKGVTIETKVEHTGSAMGEPVWAVRTIGIPGTGLKKAG